LLFQLYFLYRLDFLANSAFSWRMLKIQFFYRATRMHSADYAVPRCLSIRLSVCPPVCHRPVLCLHSYTYHQSFSQSGSPTVLVFPDQTGWKYSDGDPLTGALNARRYEKNRDLRPVSRFILELMQDRAIVTIKGE